MGLILCRLALSVPVMLFFEFTNAFPSISWRYLFRRRVYYCFDLVNGIKLLGHIESFDQYVVLLRNTVTQMVYKHAISTVVPGRAVNFNANDSEEG